jgi:hypothetical protein
MSAYVEECRREWKRLGVPDSLAEEMAAELEADLAEAEADGVSAAEMLGESDPRRFATTWATERGLVSEPRPPKSHNHKWAWITACLVLLLVLLFIFPAFVVFGVASGGSETVQVSPARRVGPIRVPKLVGLPICSAVLKAQSAGLSAHGPDGSCSALVVRQRPRAGAVVAGISSRTDFVKLWTRRASG